MALTRLAVGFTALFSSASLKSSNDQADTEVKAHVTLSGKGITGEAHLSQVRYTFNTDITIKASGLTANQKHGVHIHEGTVGNAGDIYNPFAKKHGGPWSVERKVGDLGNIKADEKGEGNYTISDPFVKLSGKFSVIGKVLAIHQNPDDLGYGRKEGSLIDGCVGDAIATGVIAQ